MSLTNYSLLAVIMPLIAVTLLTTCGFAGLTQASTVTDINKIMRDISTDVKPKPSQALTHADIAAIREILIERQNEAENGISSADKPSSGQILRYFRDKVDDEETYDDYLEIFNYKDNINYINNDNNIINDNDKNNNENNNKNDNKENKNNNNENNNNNNDKNENNKNNDIVDGNKEKPSDVKKNLQTNYYTDEDNGNNEKEYLESLNLRQQVYLLSQQVNGLMARRKEDYEKMERNFRMALGLPEPPQSEKKEEPALIGMDIGSQWVKLREDMKIIKADIDAKPLSHKEVLIIDWLQQSITELRKQIVELQQIASTAMKEVTTRTQSWEDLTTIRSDFQQLKLELAALKERQQQTDVYVQELREETAQQEEEFQHFVTKQMYSNKQANVNQPENTATQQVDGKSTSESLEEADNKDIKETSSLTQLADHKRRHCRFQRQQLHELQLSQRQLKRQFNELKYHRIAERVRSIEIEQHRIADANFNLSRQIASLDKLHSSMLELLEDVENVQTKVDKNLPELRHEISKLEFSNAQLMSEQNLVREEGKNVARSLQAMAVSVSTLQEERDGVKHMQSNVGEMRTQLDRLQTMVEDVQRALQHRQHRGFGNKDNKHHNNTSFAPQQDTTGTPTQNAEYLVAKLENVEAQFESIIEKLPKDCSEVSPTTTNIIGGGLYLIAPTGEHHPLMAHCTPDGWTTIQRRYDGSADFNRSWEDYANGFGSPAGEFWMGNEQLHHLTLNNCTSLRVVMQDIYDNVWLADYTQFYISSRSDGYRLHIGGYSGNASDALDYQQGMQFSAIDVDRDISQTHCAANYEGGWWFSHCQHANLNGRYNLGLTWFDAARNEWIAVKSSQMMVKRQSSATCNYIQELQAKSQEQTVASAASATTSATTTTTTTTTSTSSTTINSNKSIPSNNLRIPGQTQFSSPSTL